MNIFLRCYVIRIFIHILCAKVRVRPRCQDVLTVPIARAYVKLTWRTSQSRRCKPQMGPLIGSRSSGACQPGQFARFVLRWQPVNLGWGRISSCGIGSRRHVTSKTRRTISSALCPAVTGANARQAAFCTSTSKLDFGFKSIWALAPSPICCWPAA